MAKRLFRPDIIVRTIELASAEAALREMGEALDITELLRVSRPPEFRILLPETGAQMPDTPASVIVEVAPNPDPVETYDITVNSRQVATRDLHFLTEPASRPVKKTLPVPLQQGDNAIRITARNRIGTAERSLLLRFLGRGELDRRGTLYVVAIRVGRAGASPEPMPVPSARRCCAMPVRCMNTPNACCSPGTATRSRPARISKTPCGKDGHFLPSDRKFADELITHLANKNAARNQSKK